MNSNKVVDAIDDKSIPFWSGYLFQNKTFKWSATPTLIPFVNLIHDLIFDSSTPSPESAKSLLDILGLLNALLLASETGILCSVTYTDLDVVDVRFSNSTDGSYGTYWKDAYKGYDENGNYVAPSSYLYYRVGLAICLLFVSVLMVVYVFADMAGKNSNVSDDEIDEEVLLDSMIGEDDKFYLFKRIKETENYKRNHCIEWLPCYAGDAPKRLVQVEYTNLQKEFDEMEQKANKLKDLQLFCAWWKYARFTILLILATTVGGCSLCVYSLTILFLIKYPDRFVQKYGYISTTSAQSPIGTVESYFFLICCFCGLYVVTFCGAGTANAAYFTFKISERKEYLLKLKNERLTAVAKIDIDNGTEMEKIMSNKMIARNSPNKMATQKNNKTLPGGEYSINDIYDYNNEDNQ